MHYCSKLPVVICMDFSLLIFLAYRVIYNVFTNVFYVKVFYSIIVFIHSKDYLSSGSPSGVSAGQQELYPILLW